MTREESLFETFCKNKENVKEEFLVEGLIIDERKRIVKLTDINNIGVDFSNSKPLKYRYRSIYGPIDVISIFRRTSMSGRNKKEWDGNPFIYALKNDKLDPNERSREWHFEMSDEEIYKYIRRFLDVCDQIDQEYDTIIMVPSTHGINKRFMDVIFKQVKAKKKIEDFFYKSTKSDAHESRNLYAIYKYCLNKCNGDTFEAQKLEDDILAKIDEGFDMMKGELFQAAKIKKEYLQFIDLIVTRNNKYTPDIASSLITGKRVLVLDDILSTGASVSSCVKNINLYNPEKIDVITLLSDKNRGIARNKPVIK